MRKISLAFVSLMAAAAVSSLAGSAPADTISGYKKPAFQITSSYGQWLAGKLGINPNDPLGVDHTYACVSGGGVLTNGCYAVQASGSASTTVGGSSVTSGNGSGADAACYSKCSIGTYGITGVCHQHTNRVLFPAGRTLGSSVRGYGLSLAMFGATSNKNPANSYSFQKCVESCGKLFSVATN
jgi:hypothetical protein